MDQLKVKTSKPTKEELKKMIQLAESSSLANVAIMVGPAENLDWIEKITSHLGQRGEVYTLNTESVKTQIGSQKVIKGPKEKSKAIEGDKTIKTMRAEVEYSVSEWVEKKVTVLIFTDRRKVMQNMGDVLSVNLQWQKREAMISNLITILENLPKAMVPKTGWKFRDMFKK